MSLNFDEGFLSLMTCEVDGEVCRLATFHYSLELLAVLNLIRLAPHSRLILNTK